MESLKELLQFLVPEQRLDLKAVSLTHILGLTGSAEGKSLLFELPEIIEAVIKLTFDKTPTIAKDAVLCLINLTSEEIGAVKLYENRKNIARLAIESIINENCELADPWTMVLSNLTRVEILVEQILNEFDEKNDDKSLLMLIKAFSRLDYNKKKAKLHYLGPIFCNITQTVRGRDLFCNSKHNLLERIISFVSYQDSVVRRGGTIGVLKNICFDPTYHYLILNDKDEILYSLLLPLAGPEEFTDEENEKFPIELQYLGENKKREEDPDLRIMLLESLLQLCATKFYREFLRSKGTYEILREYHKWEANIGGDKEALLACEKVVDILIRREHEIGIDNLKEVEVPSDLTQKFYEDDQSFINDE